MDYPFFFVNIYLEVYHKVIEIRQLLQANKAICGFMKAVHITSTGVFNYFRWLMDRNYVFNPTLGSIRELYFIPDYKFQLSELKEKFPTGWNNLICIEHNSTAQNFTETSITFTNAFIKGNNDESITYLYTPTCENVNDTSRNLIKFNKLNSDFLYVCTFPTLDLRSIELRSSNENVEYLCAVRMSYKANPMSYLSLECNPWSSVSVYVEYTHASLNDAILFHNFKQFLLPDNEILDKHFVRWLLKMSGRASDFHTDYKINFIILSPSRYFKDFEITSGFHLFVEQDTFTLLKDNM